VIQTERHIAVVAATDKGEPVERGWIKVRSLSLLGNDETILHEWVKPCLDWGFFLVPDIGEQIEIEVVSGSDKDEVPGQAFLETPDYRYRGKRFYSPNTPINEMFTSSNYGKRRGFATPGGHVFMFDDTDGSRKINLAWHSGTGEYAMFSLDEDGSIVIANKAGSLLYLNTVQQELAIIDEHGNSITLNSDGFNLIDKNSNIIRSKGSDIQVLAQGGCTISCKDAVIDAGKVQLGGQPLTEPVLLGDVLNSILGTIMSSYATHFHATLGSGGVPSDASVWTAQSALLPTAKSTTAFVKP